MADKILGNMIAWKNQTPWHGKGYQVANGATGEEMLTVAKMDWRVQRRALAMRPSPNRMLEHDNSMLTTPLENFKAIVREDTDEVFQIATSRYHPVQNIEIVNFFKEYCDAGHAELETVGGIDGGRIMWALAKLNGGGHSDKQLAGGDNLKGYILLATSHDGSLQTMGKPTIVRVVCWNTLSAALRLGNGKAKGKSGMEKNEFRMKHSKKFTAEVRKEAQQIMGISIERIHATEEVAEQLSKVKVDEKGRIEYVTRLLKGQSLLEQVTENTQPSIGLLEQVVDAHEFEQLSSMPQAGKEEMNRIGKAILEAIISSPGSELQSARGTMWGALNGVTYYVDHQRGRTQDNRLSNGWFGPGDAMKSNALQVAVEMSGIKVATVGGIN